MATEGLVNAYASQQTGLVRGDFSVFIFDYFSQIIAKLFYIYFVFVAANFLKLLKTRTLFWIIRENEREKNLKKKVKKKKKSLKRKFMVLFFLSLKKI